MLTQNFLKLLLIVLIPVSYLSAKSITDEPILIIGNEEYSYKDLEKAFEKNLNRDSRKMHEISKDSLNDFINLFTNYRLKVTDAKLKGIQNEPDVKKDLEQNEKLLSESYIFDKYLTDKYVNQTMERRKTNKKIAIIQTTFMEGPLKDTLKAYNKAKKALERIQSGEEFAEVAKELSEDPRSKDLGGEIPRYITGGMIARPIEDAVYNTKKGEVFPEIVYNRNSYFVIKVLDEEPNVFVKGSQILVSNTSIKDENEAKKKAQDILQNLKKGENFAELAKEYSDDAATAKNGGYLGELYSRSTGFGLSEQHLLPEVEKALFELKDGEISDVVKSEIGYHIVKRDSTIPAEILDDPKGIKVMYKRKYHIYDQQDYMDSLAISFGYKLNHNTLEELASKIDTNTTTVKDGWDNNIDANLKGKMLFEYLDKKVNVEEFIDSLNSSNRFVGTKTSPKGLQESIEKIVHPVVFKKKVEEMEKNDPEFAALMQEFRDGILLFKIEAEEVWNKLKFDTTRARKYFEENNLVFKTDPAYDITEIYVYNEKVADSLYKLAQTDEDFEELAAKYTQRAGYREKKGAWGLLNAKESELAKYAQENNAKAGDILKPFKNNSGYSIIKINEFEPVRDKTFEESIPDITPEIQDILQKELAEKWIADIKTRVNVELKKDKLEKIIESKRN